MGDGGVNCYVSTCSTDFTGQGYVFGKGGRRNYIIPQKQPLESALEHIVIIQAKISTMFFIRQ